jgi:formylglycine-generating enzyme required for sulfatase activity
MANHIFISHASEDHDFVLSLAAALKARGIPVWIDNWDIPPGANWELTVEDALYACEQFLIVLSPAAVGSPEVRGELRTALDENKPILPVYHQKCRIPYRLRAIQYIDYRKRGTDDEGALAEVLRALGVQEADARSAPDAAGPGERVERVPETPKAPPPAQEEKVLPDILTPRQSYEPEMVLIPVGGFLMGSDPAKDKDAQDDEQPQHFLALPAYYLARTPVTNAQYLAFVQDAGQGAPGGWQGDKPPKGKEDHPVVDVTWRDALAYCRWLAQATGRPYALPSEAEWEKGARGTDGRIYPWGNDWAAARCNCYERREGDTTPVGAYPGGASPYGLLDMAGNVWEWTRSLWDREYPYVPNDGRENLEAGGARVVRGGAFDFTSGFVRCAFRLSLNPAQWVRGLGFRVVLGPGFPPSL